MQENVDRQYNILSLSGGGVRGLYTISVLAELEAMLADEKDQPDYNVAQHFDLICGTSIGGILALGLSSGRSARELYEIIDSERLKIFPQPTCKWWGRISKKFKRALSTPYSATPLKGVLESVFNDRIVGELGSAVLIPAVNYSTGAVQVFKTPHHPDFRRDWKYKLVDVALATSAAPTFFPIHKFEGAWYVDGGLAANSPALMAVHEARHFLGVPRDKIYLMQVGTMGMQKTANQTRTSQGYLTRWGFGEHLIELTVKSRMIIRTLFKKLRMGFVPFLHCQDGWLGVQS